MPTEKSNTVGVGANVPGMFPKRSDDGITEYLEEEALDPDFSLIDMDQKYGQYLPSGEAFVNTMRDDKLNLRSFSVNPYVPLLIDTLDGSDFDESSMAEAFNTITTELQDVAKQRSSYSVPMLEDPNIKLEDVPAFTDEQLGSLSRGEIESSLFTKKITNTSLTDVVTVDYFEQAQADLLFSIENKIKKRNTRVTV